VRFTCGCREGYSFSQYCDIVVHVGGCELTGPHVPADKSVDLRSAFGELALLLHFR